MEENRQTNNQNNNNTNADNSDENLLDVIIKLSDDGLNISQIAKETGTARSTISSLMRMYNHLKTSHPYIENSSNNSTNTTNNIQSDNTNNLIDFPTLSELKNENIILKSQFENLQQRHEELSSQTSQQSVVSNNLNILQDTFFDEEEEEGEDSSKDEFEKRTQIVIDLKEQIDNLKNELKLKDQDVKSLKYQITYLKSKIYDDFWLKIYNYRYFYLSLYIMAGIIIENQFSIFDAIISMDYSKIINLF
jgi:hypothetical protein